MSHNFVPLEVKSPYSLFAVIAIAGCLVYSTLFFYPKWMKGGSEATIGWDVSGYYLYLPAIFIYKDLKNLEFQNDILKDYQPTPELQQSFEHDNGNYVMKYSIGQAVQMLPFFTIAHLYALNSSRWKADGYSRPYQLLISIGALVTALIGLFFLGKYLRLFFEDKVVALSLILLCLGSNYLEYAGITGAMTHNGLFTLYALLLYASHRFYQSPGYAWSVIIGAVIGLMALTRPTEIIAVFIPITYGLGFLHSASLKDRFTWLINKRKYLVIAAIVCVFVGSWQLIYWKYVSGGWVVYSYQEQGFSWLSPHIYDGLFSYRSGWLLYSPMMIFSIIGFLYIEEIKNTRFGFAIFYAILFIYVAFAWDIWWYGGSLGQRTMVQAYPIFSIPFTFFIARIINSKRWVTTLFAILATVFLYFNLWLTYQAHKGKMLLAGQMTKAYFWKTAGTWNYNIEDLKLLDNDEEYGGAVNESSLLSLAVDSIALGNERCYQDQRLSLGSDCQFSNEIFYKNIPDGMSWLRATATCTIEVHEWNHWLMTQMIIRYYDDKHQIIKTNMIRPPRLLRPGIDRSISMDSKIPKEKFEYVGLLFWNAGSDKSILIEDMDLMAF